MSDTRTKILDLAETLTQSKGINGFSYIDLADEIGVKTSSIHYHFKLKDDLAAALVARVREAHAIGFGEIEANYDTSEERLGAVSKFFQGYIAEDKFCMCGMMAAELQSVSPRVAKLVEAYFGEFQEWLKRQFEHAGVDDAEQRAISFLSTLEGALLLGRLRGDPNVISKALQDYVRT